MNKKHQVASLTINSSIFLTVLVAIIVTIGRSVRAQYYVNPEVTWMDFFYYTDITNIVLWVASICMIIIVSMQIHNKKTYKSFKGFYIFKFISVVGTTFTFLFVFLIFFPLGEINEKYKEVSMYNGIQIITHIIAPLLGLFGFVFTEYYPTNKKWTYTLPLVEMFVYMLILIPLVVTGVYEKYSCTHWESPYPFTNFMSNPWWATILYMIFCYGLTLGIGAGIYFSNYAAFTKLYVQDTNAKKHKIKNNK